METAKAFRESDTGLFQGIVFNIAIGFENYPAISSIVEAHKGTARQVKATSDFGKSYNGLHILVADPNDPIISVAKKKFRKGLL